MVDCAIVKAPFPLAFLVIIVLKEMLYVIDFGLAIVLQKKKTHRRGYLIGLTYAVGRHPTIMIPINSAGSIKSLSVAQALTIP